MEYYTINIDMTLGKYVGDQVARMEVERIMNNLLNSEDILDFDLRAINVFEADYD